MARCKRRQSLKLKQNTSVDGQTPPKTVDKVKVVRKRKPKQKRRSREVSPCWRPKYGCGRLHWNMRNHGFIDIRRRRNKKSSSTPKKPAPVQTTKCCTALSSHETSAEECTEKNKCNKIHLTVKTNDIIIITHSGGSNTAGSTAQIIGNSVFDDQIDCPPIRSETRNENTQTENYQKDKQLSAHLDTSSSESSTSSNSTMNVDNEFPEHEPAIIKDQVNPTLNSNTDIPLPGNLEPGTPAAQLPPIFPWRNMNNNNMLSAYKLCKVVRPRGGNLPQRKCAHNARIRIERIYQSYRRGHGRRTPGVV